MERFGPRPFRQILFPNAGGKKTSAARAEELETAVCSRRAPDREYIASQSCGSPELLSIGFAPDFAAGKWKRRCRESSTCILTNPPTVPFRTETHPGREKSGTLPNRKNAIAYILNRAGKLQNRESQLNDPMS